MRRTEWDSMLAETIIVEELPPSARVVNFKYKAVWPTSGRDFVTINRFCCIDGRYFVFGTSIKHPKAPENPKFVRGEVIFGGLTFIPNPENPLSCDVIAMNLVDLKGSVPSSVANIAAVKQPLVVAEIAKILESTTDMSKYQYLVTPKEKKKKNNQKKKNCRKRKRRRERSKYKQFSKQYSKQPKQYSKQFSNHYSNQRKNPLFKKN